MPLKGKEWLDKTLCLGGLVSGAVLAINGSWVQLSAVALSCSDDRQVIHKCVQHLSSCDGMTLLLLLLSCAKSHMLSASRRQPHLLHVSAVDRRQTLSMDKSWRSVTLSGFLHIHIVRCRWNPISCGTHYSGPGLSENDSAVTTDVCEDRNREVGLWGLPLKWNWPP